MEIRVATPADRGEIRRLLAEIRDFFGEIAPAPDDLDSQLDAVLAGRSALEFLLALDPVAVAFVSLALCPTTLAARSFAYVDDLYVAPSHRGRGIAQALLRAAIGRARERGAVELRLSADMGDAPLIELYRKAGFRPRGQALLARPVEDTHEP